MYDTRVPIIGTALTRPERRVIEKTGAVVASFRVVSNSRRYDKNAWTQQVQYWHASSHLRKIFHST